MGDPTSVGQVGKNCDEVAGERLLVLDFDLDFLVWCFCGWRSWVVWSCSVPGKKSMVAGIVKWWTKKYYVMVVAHGTS